jgi:hypothetical protein
MPNKETSDELSSLAARIMYLSNKLKEHGHKYITLEIKDVQSLCGSVIGQDETKGPRDSA